MTQLALLDKNSLPKPPALRSLIGPSFILLGLGLGSGELILWPYLSSNFGMGIIWAAVVGITIQFFLNMEISRYTLATGESIFVGLTRKFGNFAPVWFILSTFIPWIWPGIIASSAAVFAQAAGFAYSKYIGIFLLFLIGALLSTGHIIYKTQEKVQKAIIIIGVPFIFILTFIFTKASGWIALGKGLIGIGQDFNFLPKSIDMATFLGALAYAGAGGTLNLAQSLYTKEKGYGMAKFSGKLTNAFRGAKEDIKLEGSTFEINDQNLKYFKLWWKRLNIEHALVFWATGAITMIMLSLFAFSTVYSNPNVSKGINFVILEAKTLSQTNLSFLGPLFLVIVGVMLFGTQFSVFGSTSRIMSENLCLLSKSKFKVKNISKYFFVFLWVQILSGVVIFLLGFSEPLRLVTIGAVLNALSMFVYSGMVLIVNIKLLQKPLRPSPYRIFTLLFAFCFYGFFGTITLLKTFNLI